MAPNHSKLAMKPSPKCACKATAKGNITSVFVTNKYHFTAEERHLCRKATHLENCEQIAFAVNNFFSFHYAEHL